MKSIQQFWLLAASLIISVTYAQVGIGTTTPQGALDVVSTDSGILLPRVANTTAVTAPVNGMMIYSIADKCIKIYQFNLWGGCFLGDYSDILQQIGDEADNPDTVNSVVTVDQISSTGVSGATLANETAYQNYIDTYPNAIANPATIAEVQTMVNNVNAGLWSPASITTEAWYDATDATTITHNANSVSQWNDKSGNKRHLTQPNATHRPLTNTRTINGLNGIEGSDNQSMEVRLATPITSPNYLVVSIYQPDELTSMSGIFRIDGVNNSSNTYEIVQLTQNSNNKFYYFSGTTSREFLVSTPSTIGVNFIASSTAKADGSVAHYLQGSSVGTSSFAPEVINSVRGFTALAINQLPNVTTRAFDGILGEVILATDTSNANRQRLEGYLAWKWGLENKLPTNHPYKATPPANNKLEEDVLVQIGNEADSPDTVNSVITATQLNTITGITNVDAANETAYQDYIDTYPNAISNPATKAEVQTMINVVNAGLWSPASITTEAWYDATDATTITHSANSVSQWNDKSGNKRHLTQPNATHRPLTNTRTINGLNGIEGSDNQSMEVRLATPITSPNYLVVSIYQPDELTSMSGIFRIDGLNNSSNTYEIVQLTQSSNNKFYYFSGTTSREFLVSTPSTIGVNFIASSTAKADGSVAHYLQGSSVGTSSFAPEVINSVRGFTALAINQLPNVTTRAMDGILGEVILATDTSDATRQRLEGYLAWKWGLEGNLPASHPYKNVPPFN